MMTFYAIFSSLTLELRKAQKKMKERKMTAFIYFQETLSLALLSFLCCVNSYELVMFLHAEKQLIYREKMQISYFSFCRQGEKVFFFVFFCTFSCSLKPQKASESILVTFKFIFYVFLHNVTLLHASELDFALLLCSHSSSSFVLVSPEWLVLGNKES